MNKQNERNYFDEGWKEIIKTYFPQFLEFFFNKIYNDIDFSREFRFLDKELEKIIKRSKEKRRYADLLVEVYLKNGEAKWIIIHIEVQGYYDKKFPERTLIYNFKAKELYGKVVVSLGILVDDDINFRLNKYEVSYWGFKFIFEFPIVKILDYRGKEKELDEIRNPFADVVLTQLKSIEKGLKIEDKLFWKITLVKRLYKKGYNRDYIINLFKFIDWVINLPKEEEDKFLKEIEKYEEVIKMPLLIPAEKIWIERGMERGMEKGMERGMEKGAVLSQQNSLIKLLQKKFRILSKDEKNKIKNCQNINKLNKIFDYALDVKKIEDVLKKL